MNLLKLFLIGCVASANSNLPFIDNDLNYYSGIRDQLIDNLRVIESEYDYVCKDDIDECDYIENGIADIDIYNAPVVTILANLGEARYMLKKHNELIDFKYAKELGAKHSYAKIDFDKAYNKAMTAIEAHNSVGTDTSYAKSLAESLNNNIESLGISSNRNLEISYYMLVHGKAIFDAISDGNFFRYESRGVSYNPTERIKNIDFLIDRSETRLEKAKQVVVDSRNSGYDVSQAEIKIAFLEDLNKDLKVYLENEDMVASAKTTQDIIEVSNSIIDGGYVKKNSVQTLTSNLKGRFTKYFFNEVPLNEQDNFAKFLINIDEEDKQVLLRESLLDLKPDVRKKLFEFDAANNKSAGYLFKHLPRVNMVISNEYADAKVELDHRLKIVEQVLFDLISSNTMTFDQEMKLNSMFKKLRSDFFVYESAKKLYSTLNNLKSALELSSSKSEVSDILNRYESIFDNLSDESLNERYNKGFIPFVDVHESDWKIDYVKPLKEKGVVSGYGDGTFAPDRDITRAELLKMAILSFDHKLNSTVDVEFVDVFEDTWIEEVFSKAIDLGIYDNKKDFIRPNERINRAEALRAILISSGVEVPDYNDTDFKDVTQGWQIKYVQYAKEEGIVSGYTDGTFRPNSKITRAEMAKLIAKLL